MARKLVESTVRTCAWYPSIVSINTEHVSNMYFDYRSHKYTYTLVQVIPDLVSDGIKAHFECNGGSKDGGNINRVTLEESVVHSTCKTRRSTSSRHFGFEEGGVKREEKGRNTIRLATKTQKYRVTSSQTTTDFFLWSTNCWHDADIQPSSNLLLVYKTQQRNDGIFQYFDFVIASFVPSTYIP